MTTLRFTKMEGTGNDFILVDGMEQNTETLRPHVARLCDRRFGIGADQILVVEPSNAAEVRLRIFNADGSEVEMCGNGVRCLARYLRDRGRAPGDHLTVETAAGIITPRFHKDAVAVDMGAPVLDASRIPVRMEGQVISKPLRDEDAEWSITCVSMGNPHCVIRVPEVKDFPVGRVGPRIETHALFPQRTNVEFVEILGEREIRMRVWERGAGETLSCGTGACAAVVACSLNGWTARDVTVRLPGGDLHVQWGEDNRVILKGSAREVFSGRIEI